MPKGAKVHEPDAPPRVHCDFCGGTFAPEHWNCRTCPTCRAEGRPCQCEDGYGRKLSALGLTGRDPERRALAMKARQSRRETAGANLPPSAASATPNTRTLSLSDTRP